MEAPFRSALSRAAAAALSSTSLAVTEAAPDKAAAIEAAPHLQEEGANNIHSRHNKYHDSLLVNNFNSEEIASTLGFE